MDLELMEQLRSLANDIGDFIDNMDDIVYDQSEDDKEFKFMEDESGVSNTEMDNLLETLHHGLELTNKMIAK